MSTQHKERLAIQGGKPVREKPFPERNPHSLEDASELIDALRNQNLCFPWGKKVYDFQRKFAELYGVKYAVASTSGTSAIHVAVGAINPNPGDEIITSPITDMGTVAPIVLSNCIPIFADVEPGTFNLDPEKVKEKITERTKAIIVVHCWGQPADMDKIMDIAKEHNIYVIEDCSQVHLTRYKGKLAGTIGHIGTFSLQATKHLQCGDGGVTITNNTELGERGTLFIDKGCKWDEDRRKRMMYSFFAPCYRMTELQGAVLLAQMKRLEWIVKTRQKLGDKLTSLLEGIPGIFPPERTEGVEHSYWFYPIRIDKKILGISAEEFGKALSAEGAPVFGNWIGKPLYLYESLANQIAYGSSHCPFDCPHASRKIEYKKGLCPNAELALDQLQALYLYETYTEEDIQDIARAVRKLAEYYANQ